MLSSMRKTYNAAFRAKVAFEAAKGEKTIIQIAGDFSVHPNQIRTLMMTLTDSEALQFSRTLTVPPILTS